MIEFTARPDDDGNIKCDSLKPFAGSRIVFFAMPVSERGKNPLRFYRGVWLPLITKCLIDAGYHREDLDFITLEEGVIDENYVHGYLKRRAHIDTVKNGTPAHKMHSFMEFVNKICLEDFNIVLPDPYERINFLK